MEDLKVNHLPTLTHKLLVGSLNTATGENTKKEKSIGSRTENPAK